MNGSAQRFSRWPQRRLGDVAQRIFVGLADARHRDVADREVPLLNVRDLRDGRVPSLDQLGVRSVSAGADLDRYTVQPNDVIVTCRGSQLKTAIASEGCNGAVASANLLMVRTGPELMAPVLFAYLQTAEGNAALLQRGRSSTASLLITPKAMGDMLVPLPPIDVQHQIAELVTAAEQNYVVAIRAADQRRAVARAVARELLQGDVQHDGEVHG